MTRGCGTGIRAAASTRRGPFRRLQPDARPPHRNRLRSRHRGLPHDLGRVCDRQPRRVRRRALHRPGRRFSPSSRRLSRTSGRTSRTSRRTRRQQTLLDDLCRALDSEHEGCLSVLRHGFKCFGKLFRAAYFAPASGMNPETAAALRGEPADHHAPGALLDPAREHARRGPRPQRHPRRHGRAEEPDDRADLARRRAPVPDTTATRTI